MVNQDRLAQTEILSKIDCYMHWWMNRRCNFACAYCIRGSGNDLARSEHPECGKYSPARISRRFDDTHKTWCIYLTGGEPFLYPDFVPLSVELTKRHYLWLSTNLSMANTYEFAQVIKSHRVVAINANIHVLEREKIKNGPHKFLERFLYFQEQGFNIKLVYVAYPPVLERIKMDIERLRSAGVEQIVIKIFQGTYAAKRYPRDYSEDERMFLGALGLRNSEQDILTGRTCFLGKRCRAGQSVFYMDIAGNVTRCSTLKDEYGNLFEGTFSPGRSARRCPAKRCVCYYQGIEFASGRGRFVPHKTVVRPIRWLVSVGDWIDDLMH